jgi:hypothetical protein
VQHELERHGYLDEQRARARRTLGRLSLGLLALAVLGSGVALASRTGAPGPPHALWLAVGVGAAALVGLGLSGAMSRLSDRGAAEAARWRAMSQGLAAVARGKTTAHRIDWPAMLPLAVAFGVGAPLAARLGDLGIALPDWYTRRPLGDTAHTDGFASLISTSAAAASGDASAGHGGASGAAHGGGGTHGGAGGGSSSAD